MNDYDIIRLFKKLKKIQTDTQAANTLGINPSFFSNVRNKRTRIPERLIVEMAKIAGPEITDAWGERCKKRIRDKI